MSRGYYALLWDEQVRVLPASVERYYHFADKIVSATGVANDSELQIEFDPSYQELTIHRVEILRGGRRINAFQRADVRVIQQERELERRIFNGRISLFLPLRDVRVGDRIELDYTIRGDNPIFGGRYADAFALRFGSPCALRRVRLLWPQDRPLLIKTHGIELEPKTSVDGPTKELVWELSSQGATSLEDEVPSDVEQVPWLQLSEFSTWAEVARWANHLFDAPQLPAEVWEATGLSSYEQKKLEERVIAATQFALREDPVGTRRGVSQRDAARRRAPAARRLPRRASPSAA